MATSTSKSVRYVILKVFPQGRWELVQGTGHWKFASEEVALEKAQDLARANRMYEFIVAKTIGTVRAIEVPVIVEKHEEQEQGASEDEPEDEDMDE